MQLKRLREKQGLSVRALASKASMSYTYVSNVENGKVDPSLSALKRLAKALGVTASQLIREDRAKPNRR
ncbi:MAG TPA: helix-turn-helix transcriptional regulator [Nitrospiraceae bacterium]|nr:helix-turn-helix transcriptional regulator [Nitrospiraceae bacterium]